MQINVYSERFEVTPQLRTVVVSRLLAALGPFGAHVESVAVRLQTTTGHSQRDTAICDAAARLRPFGEVRARAEDVTMHGAIARASADIRRAVEDEVFRLQAAPRASHASNTGQQLREWLERPENYLRPIRIREYWRPSGAEDDEVPQELELALSGAE